MLGGLTLNRQGESLCLFCLYGHPVEATNMEADAGTRSRNRRQPQQNAPIQAHGDTNGIEDGQSTMQQENGMHERPIPEQTFFLKTFTNLHKPT